MKKILTEFNYLSESKDRALIKIAGDVDLTTMTEFADFINKMMELPCKTMIFDLKNLRYMNSTGFGKLASLAIEEKEKGGREMLFCNMQPAILSTYSLFGLENIWQQFPSVDAALASLQSGQPVVNEDKVMFPLIRSCTNCHRPSNFSKPGHYKCPYCNTIHQLDEKGTLAQIAAPKKKTQEQSAEQINDEIDISLPSDAIHLSRVRDFIFSFFSDTFSDQERTDMAMAVDEACENAIEHAHKFDRNKRIYLHLEISLQKVSLTIKDSGENSFKNLVQAEHVNQDQLKRTGRGMGLFLIKQIMDEVNIKPTEKWGTAITMTKYVKKKE
jgi:serine/threonine-protein kinase RsbW